MKSFASLAVVIPLLASTSVSAHGFLNSITIAGKAFKGNTPAQGTSPSVIRQVSSPNPNYGADNPALTCGPDAKAASLVADANPGDQLTFKWTGEDGSNWPHDTGPMQTYMASCGSTTCDKFDSSQAKWFKISEDGRRADGLWQQKTLFDGGVANSTIPSTLAPGNYLLRHEIIALHLASEGPGKAEFYPACAQLRVGGSQSGAPASGDLVSIPGAYNDNDPGLFDKDAYDAKVAYDFPGPAISTLGGTLPASGSSSGSGNSGNGSTTPSTTSGSAPQATTSSKAGKQCKLKKRAVAADAFAVVRPRHISRVMRGLGIGGSKH
ncbi:hypothetical protein D9613_010339 [Agrocybe pediades]|uniref:lytic cellulose monooxygenase (C4-dehydrogenating) n=1 Tax=Agrocybe pediades TaxID=84607 RepID=A0A8H4QFC6_9AGAR|nr:hypothetical protein D9613_010339 [Agrocybe pediades]